MATRKDREAAGTAVMDDRRNDGRGAWMASERTDRMSGSEDRVAAQRPAEPPPAEAKEAEPPKREGRGRKNGGRIVKHASNPNDRRRSVGRSVAGGPTRPAWPTKAAKEKNHGPHTEQRARRGGDAEPWMARSTQHEAGMPNSYHRVR